MNMIIFCKKDKTDNLKNYLKSFNIVWSDGSKLDSPIQASLWGKYGDDTVYYVEGIFLSISDYEYYVRHYDLYKNYEHLHFGQGKRIKDLLMCRKER